MTRHSPEPAIFHGFSLPGIFTFATLLWIVSAGVIFHRLPLAADDAFIHMRVARHLWFEGVPYFNVGDPVKASTATLWMLLLSLLVPIAPDLPWAVGLMNSLILTGSALVWGSILAEQTERYRRGALILGTALSWGIMLPVSASLMETPLALLLVGLSYLAIIKARFSVAAWGVLAIFVRPECVVFWGLFALTIFFKESLRSAVLFLVRGIAIALPLLIFEWHFFDTLDPHTARAKAIVYPVSSQITASDMFTTYFGLEILPALMLGSFIGAGFLFSLLQRIRNTSIKSLRPFPCPLILGGIVIALTYIGRQTFLFPWYLPLLFLPFLVAGFGAPRVCGTGGWAIALGLLIPPGVHMHTYLSKTAHVVDAPTAFAARTGLYREIGSLLAKHFPAARLMASEIGGLGFEFPGPIIDSVGLASPQAIAFQPMSNPNHFGGVPPRLVRTMEPELIIGLMFHLEELVHTPDISSQYTKLYLSLIPDSNRYRLGTERPEDPLAVGLLMRSDVVAKSPSTHFWGAVRDLVRSQ